MEEKAQLLHGIESVAIYNYSYTVEWGCGKGANPTPIHFSQEINYVHLCTSTLHLLHASSPTVTVLCKETTWFWTHAL